MVRGYSPRQYPSPLRYPGGKGKVANYVKLLVLHNDLVGVDYVEPYAGGASVALGLLFEGLVGHVHINDVDRSVHAFWVSVLEHTDALCDRIASTPMSMEEWRRQRAVQAEPGQDPLALGFSTFVLNRTNRSGIITGGVIGGYDQTGPWKLDARWDPDQLIARIQKIGRHRNQITLTNLDAAEVLSMWSQRSARALLYLDPPYYRKGQMLYTNFYEHQHHVDIAAQVRELPHPWLVSYDAVPEILDLYGAAGQRSYELNYTAQMRYHGSEVLFMSDGLVDINTPSPAGVSIADVDRAKAVAWG
jgi:DNA adenine methylase